MAVAEKINTFHTGILNNDARTRLAHRLQSSSHVAHNAGWSTLRQVQEGAARVRHEQAGIHRTTTTAVLTCTLTLHLFWTKTI